MLIGWRSCSNEIADNGFSDEQLGKMTKNCAAHGAFADNFTQFSPRAETEALWVVERFSAILSLVLSQVVLYSHESFQFSKRG
ncbi:hypothetical protein ACNKHL_13395 [Shigella flexneri]